MWATKIGPASRGELLEWLRTDVGDRAHVPTWAAHEYLRHHVAGTIVGELEKKTTEISQLAGGTFNYFRPFLDDPALQAADPWDRLRSSTRDAINTLGLLAAASKKWKNAYPAHAREIIDYINSYNSARVLPSIPIRVRRSASMAHRASPQRSTDFHLSELKGRGGASVYAPPK
jgi:hypothetical protein